MLKRENEQDLGILYYIKVYIIKPTFKERLNVSKKNKAYNLIYLDNIESIIFSIITFIPFYVIYFQLSPVIDPLRASILSTFFFYMITLDLDDLIWENLYIIDLEISSSAIRHELIHAKIFKKITHLKQWKIVLVNNELQCHEYYPPNYLIPKHISQIIFTDFCDLIHDFFMCVFQGTILSILSYLKRFFTDNYNFFIKYINKRS